jgi:hypothetical protein
MVPSKRSPRRRWIAAYYRQGLTVDPATAFAARMLFWRRVQLRGWVHP